MGSTEITEFAEGTEEGSGVRGTCNTEITEFAEGTEEGTGVHWT